MTLDAFSINFILPFKVEKQVEQIECLYGMVEHCHPPGSQWTVPLSSEGTREKQREREQVVQLQPACDRHMETPEEMPHLGR